MEFKKLKIKEITNNVTDYVANGSFKSLKENVHVSEEKSDAIMIRLVDFNNGFNGPYKYVDEESYNFLQKTKLFGGEVIISNVGANAGTVFKAPYFLNKMTLGPNSIMVDFKGENDFFYYYFKSKEGKFKLSSIMSGSAQPKFNKTDFKNLIIKVPDVKNQKKIAKMLSKIDEKIENNQKIIANLEELSQTLFKHWFVDFEFPDENGNPFKSSGGEMVDSELGEMPSGWSINPLENFMTIKSGKRPPRKSEIKKGIYNFPIIGASKIMGYTDEILYDEKILVMGRVGTHGIIQKYYGCTWPSDNTFVIKSDYFEYVYQYLKMIDYKSLNRGSTQPLLSQKDIKNYSVKSPDDNTLVKKFEIEVLYANQLIKTKNVENDKLTILRDTLLPKLMSGEIEIPDDVEVDEDGL